MCRARNAEDRRCPGHHGARARYRKTLREATSGNPTTQNRADVARSSQDIETVKAAMYDHRPEVREAAAENQLAAVAAAQIAEETTSLARIQSALADPRPEVAAAAARNPRAARLDLTPGDTANSTPAADPAPGRGVRTYPPATAEHYEQLETLQNSLAIGWAPRDEATLSTLNYLQAIVSGSDTDVDAARAAYLEANPDQKPKKPRRPRPPRAPKPKVTLAPAAAAEIQAGVLDLPAGQGYRFTIQGRNFTVWNSAEGTFDIASSDNTPERHNDYIIEHRVPAGDRQQAAAGVARYVEGRLNGSGPDLDTLPESQAHDLAIEAGRAGDRVVLTAAARSEHSAVRMVAATSLETPLSELRRLTRDEDLLVARAAEESVEYREEERARRAA